MTGTVDRAMASNRFWQLSTFVRVAVTYALLLWVWSPALESTHTNDSLQDWSYGAEYRSYATTALFDFGEIPYFAWQGRHKGHRNTAFDTFFANPETPALSPTLPLYRLLDHEQASRLDRQIRLLVGIIGAYVLLLAWLGTVSLWTLLAFCLLYFANGAIAGHSLVGHGMAGGLFVLPLALGLFLKALQQPEWRRVPPAAVGCGAVLAILVYDGASHFLTHFILFLTLYAILACAISPAKSRAILVTWLVTLASFSLLGAYKLLPMMDIYSGYQADYRIAFSNAHELVTQFQPVTASMEFEHEVNSYVGIIGAALFAAALFYWNRRTTPFLLAGLFFLLLTWLPIANWLVQTAPFFETQGAFTRFRIGFLFAFSCVAAGLVDSAMRRFTASSGFTRTAAWTIAVILLLGLATDLRMQNFDRRSRLLMTDPYPPIQRARIAAIPFGSADGLIEVRPVARGVNWARYEYRHSFVADEDPRIQSPALKNGVGHLVFTGDVRVTSIGDGPPSLVLTQPQGKFEYAFHHRAATWGGWITAASLAALTCWGVARWRSHRARPT